MAVPETITEEQFAAAYRAGFPLTIRFLQSNGAKYELAEEISQAAWSRGWEYRAQLKSHGAIGIWVNSIAKNLLRRDFRQRKPVQTLSDEALISEASTDSAALGDLLSRCGEDDRALLIRHYMEGWSSDELAPSLGISPVSVRVRILRIKASLRKAVMLPPSREPLAAAGF